MRVTRVKYLTLVVFIAFVLAAIGCGKSQDQNNSSNNVQADQTLICPESWTMKSIPNLCACIPPENSGLLPCYCAYNAEAWSAGCTGNWSPTNSPYWSQLQNFD